MPDGRRRPIIDNWGTKKSDDVQRRDLLESVDGRHQRRSTTVTTQLPVDRWYGIICKPCLRPGTWTDGPRGRYS